jgi:hypothetical protein
MNSFIHMEGISRCPYFEERQEDPCDWLSKYFSFLNFVYLFLSVPADLFFTLKCIIIQALLLFPSTKRC